MEKSKSGFHPKNRPNESSYPTTFREEALFSRSQFFFLNLSTNMILKTNLFVFPREWSLKAIIKHQKWKKVNQDSILRTNLMSHPTTTFREEAPFSRNQFFFSQLVHKHDSKSQSFCFSSRVVVESNPKVLLVYGYNEQFGVVLKRGDWGVVVHGR